MRLSAINWIFLACTAAALSSEPRPRRHLHEIKQIIANKLFSRNETNCTQPQPSQPETRFYSIPGFNDVVIKAVPKGSTVTPPPLIEKIPSNSHIGVIGSYIGTNTLNETYNALVGVKNLVKSGILEAKRGALEKLTLLKPSNKKPVKPCPNPEPISPPITVEPVGVIVNPPKVPELVPTRYSYKQVNQDGSVTTYTSFLDFNQGVKVTEEGKTLPFIINRIQKIPVQLPVPVLPEVSKIVSPFDGKFGYPVIQPDYSYKQMHHDGRLTTYTGLPSMYNKNDGPVVVTEMGNIPPPPVFLLDRTEKVNAVVPKAPIVDIIGPKPIAFDVPAGHVIYNAPVFGSPLSAPVSGGYSYTQMHGSGGMTTAHPGLGMFDVPVKSPAAFMGTPPFSVYPSIPERNQFGHYAPVSAHQAYLRGTVSTNYDGSRVGKQGANFSESEHLAFGVQPSGPYKFSYKQVGDGKVTTYTGAEIINRPASPPHVTDRIEKVVTGAKFNQIPVSTMPLVDRFAVPVPNDFVDIPSVLTSVPQRPVKIPAASGTSPFVYKHIQTGGSATSYDEDVSIHEQDLKNQAPQSSMPAAHGNTRVSEFPIYTSPFPINVNPNAFKPSTPVSYSYKLLNDGQVDYHYEIGPNEQFPSTGLPNNPPFPVPPVFPVLPASVQGCVDPEANNPIVGRSPALTQQAVPLAYSYTETSDHQSGTFLPASFEDPVMAANKINMRMSESNQAQHNYPIEYQNVNEDYYLNPNDYVYIPPARYDEIPPPIKPLHFPKSRFPQKKFSNRWLYENFDGYNFKSVKTNQPPTTPKPQENPADNVYVEETPVQVPLTLKPILSNRNPEYNNPIVPEQVSIPSTPPSTIYTEQTHIQIPSSPKPILNHQNSFTNNPIVVPEKASFLFKQSNPDGSTITTKNDDRNTLSVQVEEAPKSQFVRVENLRNSDDVEVKETPSPINEVPSSVSELVEESEEPEFVSSTAVPRRRKFKRVKHRGDIPDSD